MRGVARWLGVYWGRRLETCARTRSMISPIGPAPRLRAFRTPNWVRSRSSSMRTGRDHQDPQTASLLSRRTTHPLGPPVDSASSQALALGREVPERPRSASSDSTPALTAPFATDPPSGQPNLPANSRQPGPQAPPAVSYPAISLRAAIVGRHRCLCLATIRRPQPYL